MTNRHSVNDRRAMHVSAMGFVLQLATFGVLLGVSIWSRSDAIAAVARFTLFGIPIWFTLFLIFKQLNRVGVEELETAELRRTRAEGASDTIFEVDDEALLLERNRLRWLIRWLLPATTVIVCLLLFIGHFTAWGWTLDQAFAKDGIRRTLQPTMMMWFVVGVGFLCFLYARYSIALSRIPNWRFLRAGATCMAGNAFACLGLVVALMAGTTVHWAEPLFAYVIRVALILIGVEMAANFLLDFYRPRTAGLVSRPSFESRLLGLFTEPGGLAKSIADTVNYQFGFEVSSTWFYQLLQRWMFPIMVFTMIVVLALTGVVIVDADEQVVVERFGRLVSEPNEVLSPGLHVKWPFPIDVVRRAPVRRVQELVIGEATEPEHDDPRRAILWTEAHDYLPELMLLVASPRLTERGGMKSLKEKLSSSASTEAVAVSLLMVSLPIEYRIKDIKKFLYTYDDPVKVMEGVAYQYLSDYAASVDIDEMMGPGREAINSRLWELIQKRLDELNLGVEIVFAGLRGVHPPAKEQVAEAFQRVITAQTSQAALIHSAEGEARRILIAAVGTESRALALDETLRARDQLRRTPDAAPQAVQEAEDLVNDQMLGSPGKGIPPLSGAAAAQLADARAKANEMTVQMSSKVRAFETDLSAYQAAPNLYKMRKLLEVYEGMSRIRKFLIVGDPSNVVLEIETEQQGGLDRVLTEGVDAERKRKDRP